MFMDLSIIESIRYSLQYAAIATHLLSNQQVWRLHKITMLQSPKTNEEYNNLFIANHQNFVM